MHEQDSWAALEECLVSAVHRYSLFARRRAIVGTGIREKSGIYSLIHKQTPRNVFSRVQRLVLDHCSDVLRLCLAELGLDDVYKVCKLFSAGMALSSEQSSP